MDFPVNRFKQNLKAGKQQVGLWSSLSSAAATEILSDSGFDWILIDTEHAPNETPMVADQLRAASMGTASPVVRPAWNDIVILKRLLDVGVQTLLVPFIQSPEEAARAVAATRYPPARHPGRRVGPPGEPLRPCAGILRAGRRRDVRAGAAGDARRRGRARGDRRGRRRRCGVHRSLGPRRVARASGQ